jgi:hypothetical protein
MFHFSNVMSAGDLRVVQGVFDRIVKRPWFVRDEGYELELGSYLIHLYSYGIKEPNVLDEMCVRAALRRKRVISG